METPALEQLLGAYFHQDWYVDGTESQVIATFLVDEPDLGALLPSEIEWTLAACDTEEELKGLLWEKGSYYRADPATGGYRGWLQRIAEQARRAV